MIKENKSLKETFKSKGTYELESTNSTPFNEITVDKVLRNLLLEEESDELEEDSDKDGNDDDEADEEAEILYDIDDMEDGDGDSFSEID